MRLLISVAIMAFSHGAFAIEGTYDCLGDGDQYYSFNFKANGFDFVNPVSNQVEDSKIFSENWVDESLKDSDIVNKYTATKSPVSMVYQYYSKVLDDDGSVLEISLTTLSLLKESETTLLGTYNSVDVDEYGNKLDPAFSLSLFCAKR